MLNKMKTTLSVAIATYNDGQFINKCLDSVSGIADEIVVYNAKSSDDTVAKLKKYSKVKIITGPNHPIFHINKQIAIDACKSDWILQLDADEVASPELKNEILKTIVNTEFNGFWIKRKNYFLGKFLSKGGVYPDPTIRLYRRGFGKLPCKDVHEQAEVKGPVSTLTHDLLHFADKSFSRYLLRNDRYTTLLAQDFKAAGVKINFINFLNYFIIKPIHWFFLAYFRHRGYVDSFPGFVFAWYSSLRFPIAYIKLFELRHEKI
ncbi:MAG: Glycosyl transferase family 2 [Candidatus Shapirobacteria bacterium GW2011_GWE1_38_10]|uniref:Glycosyl transferase family 2 n=1 Tax=Candidatus Shapirobacteria bacterium GW2011_GWE1_38_10 TaxID=1618488 RepID=A0A0G0L7C0_9BACT|nr:MAG: Glycosyl transferase family 2 [Candidatus Shapirobacteria bacterium GW2011_GWE1_38_10]